MPWFDEQADLYEQGGYAGPAAQGVPDVQSTQPVVAPVEQGAASPAAVDPLQAPPNAFTAGSGSINAPNLFGTVDQAKLAAAQGGSTDSPKYAAMAILQKYPPTQEGLQAALPELQKVLGAGTQITGGAGNMESLNVPGLGVIHVGGDGIGWRWNPKTDANGNRVAQQGFDLQGRNLWGPNSPYSSEQQAAFQANGGIWNGQTPAGGGPSGSPAPAGGMFGGGNGFSMPSGGNGAPRTYNGPDYVPGAIAGAPVYTPQAIDGPQTFTPQQISAAQAQGGGQVHAQQVTPAAGIRPSLVGTPDAIQAQQVTGPAAIMAQQIAAAEPFKAPTLADAQNDPGFQFRLAQGQQALENAAAARGLLRTGGTLKDFINYNQDAASQEYGNVYGRRFGEYQNDIANRVNIGNANNQNAFTAYGLSNQYGQQAQLANQAANLQAATTTANLRQNSSLANMQAQLAADQFNAGQQNSIAVGNADRALSSDTFNSGQAANLSQFNAAQTNTASAQNVANSLAAWQAYQQMRQQAAQFNAARTDTASQQNFQNRFSVDQANEQNRLNAFNSNTNAKLGFGNLNLGYTRAGNDYSLGMGNLALGNKRADQDYDLGLRGNALGYYQAGNAFTLGQAANQLGWAHYGLNEQQQGFNQGYTLADLGLRAAGLFGNYAGQYGANAGNYATQAGNAAAAGQVGAANAWNQGLTGAVNAALNSYAWSQYGRQPSASTSQQAIWTGPGNAPWEQQPGGLV